MEIGVFHRYILNFFEQKELCKYKNIIKYRDALSVLSQHRIPHYMQYKFLKEMEYLGLIKIIDKQNIGIITQEEKCEILKLAETKTLEEIAKEFGVSVVAVHYWIKNAGGNSSPL